jgi:hypothetical protein
MSRVYDAAVFVSRALPRDLPQRAAHPVEGRQPTRANSATDCDP